MPRLVVTTNAPVVAETLRKYVELNKHKTAPELVVEQGKKLAIELYEQTAAVAPSRAQIEADVRTQGWRIPAYFKDGRLARGSPSDWIQGAIAALPKQRGRKSKKRQAQEAALASSRPTLEQMQAFVIRRRVHAILYVATGWLGAVIDLGGSPKQTSGTVDRERGRAEVDLGGEFARVTIINDTPGIVEVDQKHDVVRRAIVTRLADMRVYIARKLHESAEQVFGRAA